MKADIYRQILTDFGHSAPAALERVERLEGITKGLISDELVWSMVRLANGSLAAFERLIEQAREKPAEVIAQAEQHERTRDEEG